MYYIYRISNIILNVKFAPYVIDNDFSGPKWRKWAEVPPEMKLSLRLVYQQILAYFLTAKKSRNEKKDKYKSCP